MTDAEFFAGYVERTAVISSCGTYRYVLTRRWADGPFLVFVMLNPSTADAAKDDPTIRKCIGFAKRYGYSAIAVVNLFALRSTDPSALRTHSAPVGPDNDAWIEQATRDPFSRVLAAWGANAKHHEQRVRDVARIVRRPMMALSITGDGHPGHPLMLSYDRSPQPWSAT